MYENTMKVYWYSLDTGSFHSELNSFTSSIPFVTSFKDLLGKDNKSYDYNCPSWNNFCARIKSYETKFDIDLVKKVQAAIKRYLKGKRKSIDFYFKDANNIGWHLIFEFDSRCY